MNRQLDLYLEWQKKADDDLAVAEQLFTASMNTLTFCDAICFHAQQAIEKILKAYLVKNNSSFIKTHSLTYLIDLCIKINPEFDQLQNEVEMLSPYAVETRYPDSRIILTTQDVSEAIEATRKTMILVKTHLR